MNDVNFKTKMTTFVKSEWIARMTKYNPCGLMSNVRARVEYWSQLLISENVGVGAGRLCVDRGRREKGQSMGKDFYKVEM